MKVSVLSTHLSQVDAHQSPTFTSDYAPRGSDFLFSPAISAYTTVSHRATRNCLCYSQTLADGVSYTKLSYTPRDKDLIARLRLPRKFQSWPATQKDFIHS